MSHVQKQSSQGVSRQSMQKDLCMDITRDDPSLLIKRETGTSLVAQIATDSFWNLSYCNMAGALHIRSDTANLPSLIA